MFNPSITKLDYRLDAATYALFLCIGALIAFSAYYGNLKIYLLLPGILFISVIFSLKLYYFLLLVLLVRSSLEGSIFHYESLPPLHQGLAAILLLVGLIYLFFIKEEGSYRSPIVMPMVIFLSYIFALSLTSLTSEFPFIGFQHFSKLAISFIMYVLVLNVIKTRKQIDYLVWAIFLSGIVPVLFAAYQYTFDLGRVSVGFYRVTSTFSSFNKFAIHLGIATFLGVYLFLFTKSYIKKIFIGILIFGYSSFFIFTYSRGAWLAFFVMIFLMGFLKGGERYKKLSLLATIIPVTIIFFIPAVFNRLTQIFVFNEENNLLVRINWWKESLVFAYNDPITLIFGNGIGYYAISDAVIPHNDFILLLVESGLIGLLLYVFILMITIIFTYSNIKKTENREDSHLLIVCFAIICFVSILMSSENILYAVGTGWYLWAVVGISQAILKTKLKSGKEVAQALVFKT